MDLEDIYIEDYEEKLILIRNYYRLIGEGNFLRALNKFGQEEGFGNIGAVCNFASYYESWEEGYFGETGVEIRIGPPTGPDEVAIIEIETFYNVLAEESQNYIMKHPEDKDKVNADLMNIKSRFNII